MERKASLRRLGELAMSVSTLVVYWCDPDAIERIPATIHVSDSVDPPPEPLLRPFPVWPDGPLDAELAARVRSLLPDEIVPLQGERSDGQRHVDAHLSGRVQPRTRGH
jgi:hypothetical protein